MSCRSLSWRVREKISLLRAISHYPSIYLKNEPPPPSCVTRPPHHNNFPPSWIWLAAFILTVMDKLCRIDNFLDQNQFDLVCQLLTLCGARGGDKHGGDNNKHNHWLFSRLVCLIQVLSGWQHGNPVKADSLSPGRVVPFYNRRYNEYF